MFMVLTVDDEDKFESEFRSRSFPFTYNYNTNRDGHISAVGKQPRPGLSLQQ